MSRVRGRAKRCPVTSRSLSRLRPACVVLLLAGMAGCGEDPEAAAPAGATGPGSTASSGAGGSGAGAAGTGGAGGGSTSGGGAGGSSEATTAFGIAGDAFTVDGVPTFLLGVSYFDGRNWHVEDLDGLAARQFNLVRIWLDWTSSFYDPSGTIAYGRTLLDLAEACRKRGIVVDATLLDTDLSVADPDAAVRSAIQTLAAQPNVFFDLVNEHDHAGNTFSHDDVAALAVSARQENPAALLTVSSQGGHIVDDLTLAPDNIDAEIVGAGLDFLAPHLSRTPDFYDKTDQRVALVKEHLAAIGKPVPVYLQEEARRGHSGLDPTLEQFLQAAGEAKGAGAAGWVFHTDAGFDLAAGTFFDQLDDVEKATVDALGASVFGR